MMQAFENHTQWTAVKEVCRRLKDAGHQALLAGGCVRDLLMNREPHDFDVATSATPDQVELLFPKSLTVGKAFGVVILPYEGFQIEVATFREDGPYLDGRRPETIRFASAEADAQRRDFTVNALFLDIDEKKVIDYVGGQEDIQRRVIRTVGEPDKRFEEDKLRLLRAIRFSAQLDFQIDFKTFDAVRRLAPDIRVVSRERVRDELLKLLLTKGRVRGLELLHSSGLLDALFSDSSAIIGRDPVEWVKPFKSLAPDDKDSIVLLSLFFLPRYHELVFSQGAAEAERALRDSKLKGLRLENRAIDSILFSLRHLKEYREPKKVRRGEMALLLSHVASKHAENLASCLEKAASDLTPDSPCFAEPTEREIYIWELKAKSLGSGGARPAPVLTGEDLKAAGFSAGPRMGKILHESLLLQLEGAFADRDAALEWLRHQQK